MDRNLSIRNAQKPLLLVATREGGVDRNTYTAHYSMSAQDVATREGGVDRNVSSAVPLLFASGSPPARVAWIETKKENRPYGKKPSRHPRGWRG